MSTTEIKTFAAIRHFAASNTEFKPAIVMDTLPKTRSGFDCEYYWKDALEPGHFQKAAQGDDAGWEMDVTPDDLKGFVSTFNQMRENGVDVPIVQDHRDERIKNGKFNPDESIEKSKNTLGYIVGMKYGDDGKLYELHQFLGPAASEEGRKNLVSVGICDGFTDGKGRTYGKAIIHSASTPVPVVPNQGEFFKAASRAAADAGSSNPAAQTSQGDLPMADKMLKCSDEHMASLHKLVPGLQESPDDEKAARIVQHLHTMSAMNDDDAGGPSVVSTMSRADIDKKANENRKAWKAGELRLTSENTALTTKVTELSARVVKPLDPEAEAAIVESAETKAGNAVARGAISPACRDNLMSLLIGAKDKRNTLTLSRAANPRGDKALALAIFDVLADNRPVELGSQTSIQTLSREVPGDKTKEEKQKETAQAALLAAANGK